MRPLPLLTFAVATAAGLWSPSPAAAVDVLYRCGDAGAVVARYLEDAVATVREGVRQRLPQRPSASGARYAAVGADDGGETTLWSKGREATVVWRGAPLPPCRASLTLRAPVAARGNEPGWRADLANGRLTLSLAYGTRRIAAAAPAPQAVGEALLYRLPAERVALQIAPGPCRDSMTGTPYPLRARLQTPEADLPGCAGDPAALLTGAPWRIVAIDGGGALPGAEATLAVSRRPDGGLRLSGSTGCNRFTGAASLTGEGLTIGPLAATKRACPDPQMRQEARLFDALAAVAAFDLTPGGGLALRGARGRARVLALRP